METTKKGNDIMKNIKEEVIETDRLVLRFIKKEDIEDIYEYAKDEETGPRAGWKPHESIEATTTLVNDWISREEGEIVFVVVKKENDKVIGTMGVRLLEDKNSEEFTKTIRGILNVNGRIYEIGNVIAKVEWGKGYSTEALAGMQKMLFEKADADAIVTCHYALNAGSSRVQEKNHMRVLYECEKEHPWFNTDNAKFIARGITKSEWLNLKKDRTLSME